VQKYSFTRCYFCNHFKIHFVFTKNITPFTAFAKRFPPCKVKRCLASQQVAVYCRNDLFITIVTRPQYWFHKCCPYLSSYFLRPYFNFILPHTYLALKRFLSGTFCDRTLCMRSCYPLCLVPSQSITAVLTSTL
jgi:hypothetical protein